MEFLYAQLRYNNNGSSSSSSSDSISKREKVGLLVFKDKPFKEVHIVFSTRNLTQSITKMIKIPSDGNASKDNRVLENNPMIRMPRYSLEKPCLLSTHGLRRGSSTSLNQTLSLLSLTACTRHGVTSFLPLDYVQGMGEYTRTTYNYPIFRVVHRFNDCVLEFPIPPPIGSSEEQSSELDHSKNCYQCFTPLSHRRTTYMYRDYLFCCYGCRLKACTTRYLYKKVMKSVEEEHFNFDEDSISEMEKNAIFTILS